MWFLDQGWHLLVINVLILVHLNKNRLRADARKALKAQGLSIYSENDSGISKNCILYYALINRQPLMYDPHPSKENSLINLKLDSLSPHCKALYGTRRYNYRVWVRGATCLFEIRLNFKIVCCLIQ